MIRDAMSERLIREYYACFNERRLRDAAMLVAPDATVERPPFTPSTGGRDVLVEFTGKMLHAFPDARLTIQAIEQRGENLFEVECLASGTHLNALDLGPYGVFKPSRTPTTLHLRELLEIVDDKIVYSSLSFDVQDLVHQLANIDYTALKARLDTIHQLRERLENPPSDRASQRELTERLGRELDAARLIIRPWFRR